MSHAGGAGAAAAAGAFKAKSAANAVEEARLAATANDKATRLIICLMGLLRHLRLAKQVGWQCDLRAKSKNWSYAIFFVRRRIDSQAALRAGHTNVRLGAERHARSRSYE